MAINDIVVGIGVYESAEMMNDSPSCRGGVQDIQHSPAAQLDVLRRKQPTCRTNRWADIEDDCHEVKLITSKRFE